MVLVTTAVTNIIFCNNELEGRYCKSVMKDATDRISFARELTRLRKLFKSYVSKIMKKSYYVSNTSNVTISPLTLFCNTHFYTIPQTFNLY